MQQTLQPKQKERKNVANRRGWASSFANGASIVSLSASSGLSPCSLARVLLEDLLLLTPKELREALKDPEAFFQKRGAAAGGGEATAAGGEGEKAKSDQRGSQTTTTAPSDASAASFTPLASSVSPARWIRELHECVHADSHNSPFQDALKQLTGSTYERLLESHLDAHGIAYSTESDQRASAAAVKTPDILLFSPILVHGHLVCWIDSKAQFADPRIKQHHLQTQLRAYVNRFGKGAVIYWLDFVENEPDACSTPLAKEQIDGAAAADGSSSSNSVLFTSFSAPASYDSGDILLLTDFPSHIVTLDHLLSAELTKEGWKQDPAAAVQASPTAGRSSQDERDQLSEQID